MNWRRLRYVFLPLISELRMSAGRLINIWQLYEPFGVDPGEIQKNQPEVTPRSPHPAVFFPSTRRRHSFFVSRVPPAGYTRPPDEIDVFHDGQVCITPELGKLFPTEEER